MSTAKISLIEKWLDPFLIELEVMDSPVVDLSQLTAASKRVLAESLAAQRLITFGRNGLLLEEPDGSKNLNLSNWGHNFLSAVAIQMPVGDKSIDASEKRNRRKYQDGLLKSQMVWPDLNAFRDNAFILCADHKLAAYGLPEQLYVDNNSNKLISWDGMRSLLEQILNAVSSQYKPAWIDSQSALQEALTTIFSETFKNTHDHARQDINGSDLQTSIRAINARYYSIEEALERVHTVPEDKINPAERYVRSFAPKILSSGIRNINQPQVKGFLELSVLDSGPGMAARWLRKSVCDMPPKEQLAAVLECFGKGRTTTASTGRGFGLWKVLSSLRLLHGFMSVRTNSIHAYRQFSYLNDSGLEQSSGGAQVPKEFLLDWKKELSKEPTKYAHIQGTVVSFILPMGDA